MWPGCHDIGTFDHIVWTCPCRPCNMDIRISQLDRVKFSWLGLGGSFLVRLLTWIVFMLGLCLCNVAFGISGMALSAMSGPAHVCSFAMFIFGFALFFHPFDLGLITGGSPVLCSGLLGPVAWVMALTCLVPVHVRCSFGGSSHKSFTHTPRFLQVLFIYCFSGLTAMLLQ